MSANDGEFLIKTGERIAVRGHFSPEEMQRLTGFQGSVRQMYWRHAYTPLKQQQLIATPRGKYVRARKKGPGAFAVTILDIVRNPAAIRMQHGGSITAT